MLLLSNEEVASLLSMPDCLAAMEEAYRELGEGRGASGVRSEILTPTVTPITNIKNIKPTFFIEFLRKDAPSESAAQPELSSGPWLK